VNALIPGALLYHGVRALEQKNAGEIIGL